MDVVTGPRPLERLTAQDLLMLWADELGWSEEIGALAVLDGGPLLDADGRVRVEEIRRRLEPRLALVPRFRQVLYRPRRGWAGPVGRRGRLRLADHVAGPAARPPGRRGRAAGGLRPAAPATPGPVPAAVGGLVLPGLPDRRVGLFLRAHHVHGRRRGRGRGLRGPAGPGRRRPRPGGPAMDAGPVPTAGALLRDNLRRRLRGLGRGLSRLARPGGRRRGSAGMWHELLAERAPRTSPQPPDRADRRLAVVRGRLEMARQVAHAHRPRSTTWSWPPWPGACAGCWPAAARAVEGLVLRVMVPVSLHREARAGQRQPGHGDAVPLPLGEPDPVRRLELIAPRPPPASAGPGRRRPAGSSGSWPSSAPGAGPWPASGR
jgi:hypothetical protein